MTETTTLYNTIQPLRNVAALVSLIDRVQNRSVGLPGMATFYGFSGFGKTTAAIYAANKFDTYQIQLKSCWTGRKFCKSILLEMGIKPEKTIADMVDQIAQELSYSQRPLLIDEADVLVKKNLIELARDIYESSNSPVILIGEENLPQNLQRWERVHGRMLDWVPALPACLDDVGHLAKIYCPTVELARDFQDHLLRAAQHSIRRVCNNLEKTREVATIEGITTMDLKAWGKREFFPTAAPKPRRELV